MPRPFVYINMAATVDGKITSAQREYPRFTSPADRVEMDRLRANADALLVGAGTLRADNPSLGVRTPEMRTHRLAIGKPAELTRITVTASGRLDAAGRFFSLEDGPGERIVATPRNLPTEARNALPDHATVWECGDDSVSLAALLQRLHEHGIRRLLCEGGAQLNWSLIEADLVDELHLTIAPSLLGGSAAPTIVEGAGFSMKQQRRLRLVNVTQIGDELYCRYRLRR
jgi:2,5-diamino-6-(ribosylamino)-4(3H)-pyrimidinone 5'-phosphate reductase